VSIIFEKHTHLIDVTRTQYQTAATSFAIARGGEHLRKIVSMVIDSSKPLPITYYRFKGYVRCHHAAACLDVLERQIRSIVSAMNLELWFEASGVCEKRFLS
jgi:hypothetical protein